MAFFSLRIHVGLMLSVPRTEVVGRLAWFVCCLLGCATVLRTEHTVCEFVHVLVGRRRPSDDGSLPVL